MKSHGVLRKILLAVLAVIILFALAVFFGLFRTSSVAPGVNQPLSEAQMQELRPRGRELALVGDCFGCHSKPQGPMGSGGLAIGTPFGTLHSTNITPDPDHGIGRYTREDFHRVLRDGIAPGNRNLYPAMPYVFTHLTRPDDIDALYAYFMSLPPIAEANVPNTGAFRLPVRQFMNFWNLLNFPDRQPPDDPQRSAQWLRGGYLVEGLGHCAACHTPQNFMMGTDFSRPLQGGEIDGMRVPDITAATLTRRGFNVDTLSQYLSTGIAPQGTAFAGMYTVVHFSTGAMEDGDVEAVATYLLTGPDGKIAAPAAPPAPLPAATAADTPATAGTAAGDAATATAAATGPGADLTAGRLSYMSACAGCHGANGEGIPNVAPAMKGNSTLAMEDPHNLISVVLNGVPTQTFPGGQRMYAMPGFAHLLSDQEIAELATWARAEWGDQGVTVTEAQVQAMPRSRD